MKKAGNNFRVSFNVVLTGLEFMEVGDNVYFACGCVTTGRGSITVGNNVQFGPNTVLASANHMLIDGRFDQHYQVGSIGVEENSWIGANVTLLAGCSIPKSSVVGAGSVVN